MKTDVYTMIQPQPAPRAWDGWMMAFWGTVLVAFALRFFRLADMPLHHDESLYSVYCWRFFTGQGYQYDPMLHGPLMYHFQLLIFFLFGVGDHAVRIAPAFFGTLLVASTYFLKEAIGKVGIVLVAVFVTFSPTHLYFSRFMREDSYMAFFTYTSAVFGILYTMTRAKRHLYLAAAAFALMFCVKESSYIHAFIFVTFLILQEIVQMLVFRMPGASQHKSNSALRTYLQKRFPADYRDDSLVRLRLYLADQKYPLFFAGCIFFWIYLLLYTTFFTHPAGFLDGLYRKSLVYWWGQHREQRIKGPFLYYVPFLLIYELPVVLIMAGGILTKLARALHASIIIGWATIFSLLLIGLYGQRPLPAGFEFTHMEIWADLIISVYVLAIGLWATIILIARSENVTALFTYWAAVGFLIFSYAGEKVPWLLLHIVLPVFVLAAIFLRELWEADFWQRRSPRMTALKWGGSGVAVMLGLFTLHTTIPLNYQNRANPVERMVYTQTSTDMLKMLAVIKDVQFALGAEEAKKPVIAVQGNAVWPLAWYLRDYDGWFHPDSLANTRRPMAVIDWEQREEYRDTFGADYQEIRVKLREWWVPESAGTPGDWWRYFLYRKVYNPTGSSDILLYIKKQ